MLLLFADYKALVLQDYRHKKMANALSLRLIYPTPAKLKEECLAVCNERFSRKDEQILRTFFGQGSDLKSCAKAIERCDTDKFRPLVNFLKKQDSNTDPKNVELLAWLINYESRPHEHGRKSDPLNSVISDTRKEQPQDNDDSKEVIFLEKNDREERDKKNIFLLLFSWKPYFNFKAIVLIASIIILVSVVVFAYWLRNNKSGPEKCMYWTGDHYEQVSCSSQKLGDTMVIAFDSVRLYNFKRITKPDTITQTAIGRVWYIRIGNKFEFYTSEGFHPINPRLRLKPITEYIINKYLKGQKME